MDFLDLNSIKQHLSTLPRGIVPAFQPIIIQEVKFIIYAGKGVFCESSSNFDQLFFYQSVEIGELIEVVKGITNVISPYTDVRFKLFEWSKYFQYDKKGVLVPSYRGHYVLVEDLPQIIRDIYKVQQFKSFY